MASIGQHVDMPKARAVRGTGRAQPRRAVAAEVYERLWRLNQNFEEARRYLRELGPEGIGIFSGGQVGPYAELVEEAQLALNSFLLGELETWATEGAVNSFGGGRCAKPPKQRASSGKNIPLRRTA
jgi:hypothetical protein